MANYKLLTGPFEGSVVEDGTQVLDLAFEQLDDDLQIRIHNWAEQNYLTIDDGENYARKGGADTPLSMNQIKEDYESSWDSEETDDEADLKPVSEW